MHHARAENLDPARLLADGAAGTTTHAALHVHLGGGFGEGEKARPKARRSPAKDPVGEAGQRRFEIDETDSFVDAQSFYLLECGRV